MRKKEGFSAWDDRSKLVSMFLAAFMLLAPSGYFSAATVLAQGESKVIFYSMRTDQETMDGVVIGAEHRATNTLSWKGIPYAQPPVGDLRWKAPQKPNKRSTPLKAVNFCEICPQYIDHDGNLATPQVVKGSEDCLDLN